MTTLDVRSSTVNASIDKIQWGKNDYLIDRASAYFFIRDANGRDVSVRFEEVEDLIKALKKAKELWHNKM